MAAQDKLTPTAITLANNLNGTRLSTGATFKMPSKAKSKWDNPFMDVVKFFASIYAKQNKIATGDMSWNHKLDDNQPLQDAFALDQNLAQLTLGNVVAITEAEWNEFQTAISRCYNIIKWLPPVASLPYTPTEMTNLYSLAGIGYDTTNNIYGADGELLYSNASKAAPNYIWHTKWNELKVPYDKVLKVDTPYVAPIAPSGANPNSNYYRFTGNRRWFFDQSMIEIGL